eukprot:GFUD01017394.1.p1 GENE.GFUD01017394.1~~GFUD01017394.1.p1  ORF type:complete len:266 (+),score=28.64 GFUD01017394.1:47-844(+)
MFIKFLLLLVLGVINPQYNFYPQPPQAPTQSPDDWWYSMGDDWEVSNKLKTISPYYAAFQQMQRQMDMYAPALHVGKTQARQKPQVHIVPRYGGSPEVGEDYYDYVYAGYENAIDFTSRADLEIHGFSVFGALYADYTGPTTGTIELFHEDTGELLATQDFSIPTSSDYVDENDGTEAVPETFPVRFSTPYLTKANEVYTLMVSYNEGKYVYGVPTGSAILAPATVQVPCMDGVVAIEFIDGSDLDNAYYNEYSDGQIPSILVKC